MTLGERIKEARKRAGITQQKLADLTGLKRNTIGVYEINGQIPSSRSLCDIARACHVNENWLRTGEGSAETALTEYEEIEAFVNEALSDRSDETKRRFLLALSRLDADGWRSLTALAEMLADDKKSDH